MAQHAWVLRVRPGYEEEYKRRHAEVWPEMLEALQQAGIRNYSIFRYGLILIGYFETDDIKRTITALAASEASKRWRAHMEPVVEYETDPNTNYPYLLPLQWHMP